MLEILAMPMMRNALIGGLLVASLAGFYGVFVVQRGLSFYGSGLAHSAFGGVALGLLLGWEPLFVAVPFTIFIALAIVWLRERTGLAGDTAIGILFAVSMALGVIFLHFKSNYAADVFAYLFGSILSITRTDLWVAAAMVAASLLTCPIWGRWAYATFDRELARADRLNVVRDDYLLSICLAVTVVVSIKLVGIVLIAAFLVIPPASARLVSKTFLSMTLCSIAVGVLSVGIGLVGSVALDLPSGPVIILVQAAIFMLALIVRR